MRANPILLLMGLLALGCDHPPVGSDANPSDDLPLPPGDLAGPPDDGGGGDQGGARNSGECDDSRTCSGGQCIELSPGGYRVCTSPRAEATMCSHGEFDQCCQSSDCGRGQKCYQWPVEPYCGGARPREHNSCAADACQKDSDCPMAAVCIPAHALGYQVRTCLPAQCKTDRDCSQKAGGVCAPIRNPCCGASYGLYCVYPGEGCRTSADCGDRGYCDVMDGAPRCVRGVPRCPA